MTVFHAAGGFQSWSPAVSTTTAIVHNTAATTKRVTANARNSLHIRSSTQEARSPVWTSPLSDFWFHCVMYSDGAGNVVGDPIIQFNSAANADVAQIRMSKGGVSTTYKIEVWSGSAWSDVGAPFTIVNSALRRLDIHVKFHASAGECHVYGNENLLLNFSGALVSEHNVCDYISLSSDTLSNSFDKYFSEVFVTDVYTVGWLAVTLFPTAAGANTAWAGTFADIDETPPAVTSDVLLATAVNQISTFVTSNTPAGSTNKDIHALVLHPVGGITAGNTATDLQIALRISGTDYFSAGLGISNVDGAVAKDSYFFRNPNGNIPWTSTVIDAIEIGIKAV